MNASLQNCNIKKNYLRPQNFWLNLQSLKKIKIIFCCKQNWKMKVQQCFECFVHICRNDKKQKLVTHLARTSFTSLLLTQMKKCCPTAMLKCSTSSMLYFVSQLIYWWSSECNNWGKTEFALKRECRLMRRDDSCCWSREKKSSETFSLCQNMYLNQLACRFNIVDRK